MNLASTALVSVILPTYNRASVIGRAIASVQSQSYPHWELIIVDDASTDGTRDLVTAVNDPRVLYVPLPVNCGHPSRPRNVGWLLARGVYIAYLDDDNAWRPDHLEILVAAAEASPDAAGAYGGRRLHYPDGVTVDIVGADQTNIDTGDGLHRRDLVQWLPEMWTETHYTNEDLEFWGRVQSRHPRGMVKVDAVLSDYYVHDGNRYNTHWLNFRRYDRAYYTRHSAWLDDADRLGRYVALATRELAAGHGGPEPATPRVLDVGCGRGWVVQALREQGIDAWGVDPSAALAPLTVAHPYHLRAAADRLPFPSQSFDVVLCTDVLAHIPEPFVERSLREMLRVCDSVLIAAVDCVDPTKTGHTTMRPRSWWLDQFAALGATPVPWADVQHGLDIVVVEPAGRRQGASVAPTSVGPL